MMETNYFGQLLIDLADHIKEEVPAIKWIDQDFGQLESFEYRPAVDFPCVLIDFVATTYDQLAELAQMGNITVMLRLGFAPFSASNQTAPLDVREKALEYYAIEQKVFEAVHGFETEYSGPLMRVSSDSEQRDKDGLRVRILTFTASYEDLSKLPLRTKRTATLKIEKPPFM